MNIKDLTGSVFGRLTVLSLVGTDPHGSIWECQCTCGNITVVPARSLRSGNTKSCGCFRVEFLPANTSHRLSNTRIYRCWSGMQSRCYNQKAVGYDLYGGRGIKVCERWLNFNNFLDDMLAGYSENLELDRIDVNGDYCKENCRWATGSIQSHNKRKRKNSLSKFVGVYPISSTGKFRVKISIDGKEKSLGYFKDEYQAATVYDNASVS